MNLSDLTERGCTGHAQIMKNMSLSPLTGVLVSHNELYNTVSVFFKTFLVSPLVLPKATVVVWCSEKLDCMEDDQ